MSAAAKLRALKAEHLDAEPRYDSALIELGTDAAGRVLTDALPELIAVVEAAESWREAAHGYGVGLHDAPQAIEAALTDLKAGLEDLAAKLDADS